MTFLTTYWSQILGYTLGTLAFCGVAPWVLMAWDGDLVKQSLGWR